MENNIKKVAVLGSGVMGTGIAAHLAGCGIPVRLLDIVPFDLTDDQKKIPAMRNKLAAGAMKVAMKTKKPTPVFYSPKDANLIEIGNFDDDMEKISDCDWIIEVVIERLDIKLKVMEQIAANRKKGSIVSTNTSGIPLKEISAKMDDEFKQHFCGTHFFNPVRHMKLLEVIPGEKSDQGMLDMLAEFGTTVLGKGIVICNDTPSFIGNRIGVYGMVSVFSKMESMDYTVQELDAIYGPEMGRPKSAVFKTVDLVGLDTVKHIIDNSASALKGIDEKEALYVVPECLSALVEAGNLGNKTKAGFYKRVGKDKFVWDWKKGEYIPVERIKFDSIKAAKKAGSPGEKIKSVINSDDRAGKFAWATTSDVLLYCVNRIPEITDHIYSIDEAMRWGYMWDLGPFEGWDAIGVEESVKRMKDDGLEIPASLQKMLDSGAKTFYDERNDGLYAWSLVNNEYEKVPTDDRVIVLKKLKKTNVVEENDGISLIDIGDGVLLLEFHTFPYHMNPIDDKIIMGMYRSIELAKEKGFKGVVVGNQAANFCAGANLVMISMLASQKEWDKLNEVVAALQDANMAMKYSDIPIVTAPAGMALGGGCEIAMHGQKCIAAVESYIGMVEMAVGLLPAGGGTKELTMRCMDSPTPHDNLLPFAKVAFETIAMAKVVMSAKEAMDINILRKGIDKIVIGRDLQLHEAKKTVLGMAAEGFDPGKPKTDITVSGVGGYSAFSVALVSMLNGGHVSEHDVKIVKKIAAVICGGTKTQTGAKVSEQHLLDLEREGFVSLCGEEKSLARIQHMVMNNKPLRN
jgi:3-hydroxyacyl-CoA dehydrogenase